MDHRFVEGEFRTQQTLLPSCLEDYVAENNPVRVIEVFIGELDLAALGFAGMVPAATASGQFDYKMKCIDADSGNAPCFKCTDFAHLWACKASFCFR